MARHPYYSLFSFLFLLLFSNNVLASDQVLPTIVVSIAPQKYILERITNNTISIIVLVNPGMDPHSYEPSPSQMRQCAKALVWFTIGVPFEDVWQPRIATLAPNLTIVSSIDGVTRLPLTSVLHGSKRENNSTKHINRSESTEKQHAHKHLHNTEDPHVWLSPMLVREMLNGIVHNLGKLFPARASEFAANARQFANELEALDKTLIERFSSIPKEKRVFLTFHPSWRYFAYNYDLHEISIEIDGKEPGPQSMRKTIDIAKTYGIRAVFVEPQFPKSAANAIASSIGAQVYEVDPLAEDLPALYSTMTDLLIESFPQ